MPIQTGDEHDEKIVQLIAGCQRGLFLYICGLLFSRELAEDVLQETNLVLWQKRADYHPDSNFYAWACRIAFYKVCQARDEQRRKVPAFSELFLQQLEPELQKLCETPSRLQDYLQECIQILNHLDRNMLERRYTSGDTTKLIAEELGKSVRTVNRSLSRIHETLFDCIDAKLAGDAGS